MAIEDIQAYLHDNSLRETIANLHAAAPNSFGPGDTEALARMRLILRILNLPEASAGDLLRTIEELLMSDARPR